MAIIKRNDIYNKDNYNKDNYNSLKINNLDAKATNTIKVVDSIMGSFKTTTAINMMKKNNTDTSYIFITPYLDEIERVKKECKGFKRFYDPVNRGKGKLNSLHELLKNEKDIATTHALFKTFDSTTVELLKAGNYILILDEVVDVVEKMNITKNDLSLILDKLAYIDEDNYLIWREEEMDYIGRFSNIKSMSENKNIIFHNGSFLFWLLPVDVFGAFKDMYVLTYLFDSQVQRYYYDMFGLKYSFYLPNEDKNSFIPKSTYHSDKIIKQNIKKNITIIDDNINNIGIDYYALSSSWYSKRNNSILVSKVKNNTVTFFKRRVKTSSKYNMWTCFKDHKSKLKGEGYTNGFISCNTRGTNEYIHKKSLAYLINRFMNPIIKEFFTSNDVKVNEEMYALSELVQWMWRSQIREDKPIVIYIPSYRMRNLLERWLDDEL